MDIKPADIKEFQDLYKKHFKLPITDTEARTKLIMLVRQMEIMHQPKAVAKSLDENGNDNEPRPNPVY